MKKLVKYGASWCGPCKQQDKEFKEHPPKYPLETIDVDELSEEEADKLLIRNVPTTILYDDDKIVKVWSGFTKTDTIDGFEVNK